MAQPPPQQQTDTPQAVTTQTNTPQVANTQTDTPTANKPADTGNILKLEDEEEKDNEKRKGTIDVYDDGGTESYMA